MFISTWGKITVACAWQCAKSPNFLIAKSAKGFVVAEIAKAIRTSSKCKRGFYFLNH